jgi:hypothetical protein
MSERRRIHLAAVIVSAGVLAGLANADSTEPIVKGDTPVKREQTSSNAARSSAKFPPVAARITTPKEARVELPLRLRDLDSPSYAIRSRAAQCLEVWVGSPELGDLLAEEFQRRILQPDLPLEVRWRIAVWQARLPKVSIAPPAEQPLPELERLVAQLDDNSYSVRAGATERLQWLAGCPQFAPPILLLLKRRLADLSLGEDSFQRIEDIRRIAWGVWLNSDPGDSFLPPVSPAQIERWLDDLARPEGRGPSLPSAHAGVSPLRRRVALQNLMDALAQDAEVPYVKAALEARLRGKPDQTSATALKELLDLTRPAIVAEVWSMRKLQEPEQRMFIGEPRVFREGANPSCFDRADDQSAHCASGNSLVPGNYPVGLAFPAPRWKQGQVEGFFYLVNLPTPRRQIAYNYFAKTDAATRLAKLSRRTLDHFLAEKRLLGDAELGMLGQLDAREVSRFAARYFLLVDDGSVEEAIDSEFSTSRKHLGGDSSRFGSICAQLAIDGTRDAIPGLLAAIQQKRIDPPKSVPYRFEWLAAFSIALRDPWPGVDAWLVEQLDNRQKLDISHNDGGEVGATAAAALLERHNEKPGAGSPEGSRWGLQLVVDPHLLNYKVAGYTYGAADSVQRVRKWWARQPESAPLPASAQVGAASTR